MAVTTFVLAIVAIGVSGWALCYTRIQAHAARAATEIAKRAEARQLAEAQGVAWQLAKGSGDSFVLTNLGPAAAIDVVASGEDVEMRDPDAWREVKRGASVRFLVSHSLASRSNSVKVTRTTVDGALDPWESELP